ncbi:pre-toxin TG domain-containing protein [Actinoplanes bogorensis]|uniref:Pre-toxin TG domain-containing protein n=1 Tax=Paractinoplanes bogorensis TaxID=1610840 RepID=A0ABS5Z3E7_9ACTN|nr:pre-toxin TG domain-containing protein [Actinoplanes bogorensis]MBU2670212.1 pre-toxin TG domain-containing protein [Actinoplanes bogorensis]
MGEIEVRVPIKVRLIGLPSDPDLVRMEQAISRLVRRRAEQVRGLLDTSPPVTSDVPAEGYESQRHDDTGYLITSYQGPSQPVRIPVRGPAAQQAALRRVTDLLDTGILDWAITDAEAREALRIISALEPEDLMRVVQMMRLSGAWATLGRQLPPDTEDAVVDLQQRMDPNVGYLMPGDTVRIEVRFGSRRRDEISGDYELRGGQLVLPALEKPLLLTGLLPSALPDLLVRAFLDGVIDADPSVRVAVSARGTLYAPNGHGPTRGLLWYDSKPLPRPAPRPDDLGKRIERPVATPLPVPARLRFLEIANSMLRRAGTVPPVEARRLQTALGNYLTWLDRQSDAALERYDPVSVWTRLYVRQVTVDIEAEVAEKVRRDKEAAEEVEREAEWAGSERKLDAVLHLLKSQVWRVREPYTQEDREHGVGYLVWQSERETAVRELIGREFLRDIMSRMGTKGFSATSAEDDFRDWLTRHPAEYEALLLARAYPTVEKYDVEIDIPAWQTAIETAIGFIPIVGNIVAAGEATFGYDLFGNKLGPVERGILAASVLLPAAGKVFKAGRAAVTVRTLARDYRLSEPEARAAYRAFTGVAPGTAGARILEQAAHDVKAGRPIRDAKRIGEVGEVLKDMGLFDTNTARELKVGATESALRGEAGRAGQEAADLFAGADEISEAIESEAARPGVTGGQKPAIDGIRVPTKKRVQLGQEHLVRLAGESERQAVARTRRVIGQKISGTPLGPVWERARAKVVGGRNLDHASRQEMFDLYNKVRDEFWTQAKGDADALRFLDEAGFEFPATGKAPLVRVTDPPAGLVNWPKAADIGVQERRVSLDHDLEKALEDNYKKAIDANNLTFQFHNPNSNRETVQVKFKLRDTPGTSAE